MKRNETFKRGRNIKIKILIWHVVGEVIKKWVEQGLSFIQLFLHISLFSENFASEVKEAYYCSML